MTAPARTPPPRHPGRPSGAGRGPVDGSGADAALLAAAYGGDIAAWDLLARRYQGFVFRCAFLVARDAELAEDITLTALIRAYRSLDSLEHPSLLRPWLMRIVDGLTRTRSRELAQRQAARPVERVPVRRLPADGPPIVNGFPGPTPAEGEAIAAAFDRLGDADRMVIAARYALGLGRSEMAAYLGIETEELDTRLRSSLGQLRTYLGDEAVAVPDAYRGAGQDGYGTSGLPARHFALFDDDLLGALAASAAFAAVPWTPDVAPMVSSRLARDATAYPEHFGRRARALRPPAPASPVVANEAVALRGHVRRRSAVRAAVGVAALVTGAVILGSVVLVEETEVTPAQLAGAGGAAPAVVRATLLPGTADVPSAAPTIAPAARATPSTAATLTPVVGPADATSTPAPGAAPAQVPALTTLTIVGTRTARDGEVAARIELDWPVASELEAVDRTQVVRRVRRGGWKPVASAPASEPLELTLRPDRRYDLRIRGFDERGQVVAADRLRVVLSVRPWDAPSIERTPGDWTTTKGGARFGGALASTSEDASISTSFSGRSVALVAPVGPDRGAMRIRVNDGAWERGELRRSTAADRAVVFSRDLETGTHSLDISVAEGVITLDSMLVVRTPALRP